MIASSALTLIATSATAADLPAIKAAGANRVPACATPGRLITYLKDRNAKLDPRFDGIATEYMRHGEDLQLRWDVAFFQMLLETGNLTFTGDVKPRQNNFAGLGATGNGEPGESFKDVTTGVRAHLEHLQMYSGEKVANPVAERTRKVQEWGVLTEWQKTIKGPVTFAQLAKKWAPSTRKYAADIEAVGDGFMNGPCKAADPRPELVAAARKGLLEEATRPVPPSAAAPPVVASAAVPPPVAPKPSAIAAKPPGDGRSALGATGVASAAPSAGQTTPAADVPASKGVTVLNAGKAETPPDAPTSAPASAPASAIATPSPQAVKTALAADTAVAVKPGKVPTTKDGAAKGSASKEPSKCNVFTASYGGQKSVIIKVVAPDAVNYTVLDVNEGTEARETDAYISAYAKGGKLVGDFKSQTLALDKAFELCPEG
ncbi:MAG: glucosaminidase domain-containing protein [Hyphomicrobium aestuarii]|nr:glucosaminidase domain-containing protein [Hyphomicrobium aestuarii]